MSKIGLIGSVGGNEPTSSGQTIRTRILYDALREEYGRDAIILCDTHNTNRSVVRFGLLFLRCILTCKDIILIVSRNGLHTFLPILSFCQKHFGKRVYNNIIGGNILELIDENPNYPSYMKTFVVNWVQMKSLVDGLQKLGVMNAEVLPNTKPIQARIDPSEYKEDGCSRFCTFSRISKAKGIELAIEAIEEVNTEAGKTIATLDIYGVPDDDYKAEFESVISKAEKEIQYKGLVPYDKSPEVLSKYYMLLFPTTFYGEGFPGTILDAYASGLPVLASDWKFNPDLIIEGITGYIYNHSSPNDFKEKLRAVITEKDRVRVNGMRANCLEEAKKYTPENVMPIIFNKIDSLRGKKK